VLFKAKQKPGWLSLAVSRDRVDIAQVSRPASGRPLVSLCETYRREGSLEHTMTRLRRDRGLDGFRLTALMPAGQYQLLQVDAPDVPAAELVSALRWRLKDLIDFPVELAVVETMLVPAAGEGAGGRQSQVFAVVARADAVRQHVEPLQRSGLGLAAIDIHENAQRNVSALFERSGRAVALLAFDETAGLLTFTAGGELCLSRRIDLSLAALAELDESERHAAYDRVTLELQRSTDHFDRQFPFVALDRLLLTGVGPVAGLRDNVVENLDIPVEMLDLAEAMDFPAIPELRATTRQAQCLASIGAALRAEVSMPAVAR
jgi:MSHA biogenesis protein MshI